MSGRRRTILLAALVLATPVSAWAVGEGALQTGSAQASISVSTSLRSCGVIEDGVACELGVSFGAVDGASSYTAAVTRADGSVIDYGAVAPGGTSLWVPYVGSGTYSVRITAYGEPESPKDADGRGEVIAKGYSSGDDADGEAAPAEGDPRYALDPGEVDSEASGRNPEQGGNAEPDGAAETEVGPAATTAPSAACTTAPAEPAPPLPMPPVEPPEDLDPENADEDFDGIPDETERATYEQQLAEYEAAVAAQAETPAPAPAC